MYFNNEGRAVVSPLDSLFCLHSRLFKSLINHLIQFVDSLFCNRNFTVDLILQRNDGRLTTSSVISQKQENVLRKTIRVAVCSR